MPHNIEEEEEEEEEEEDEAPVTLRNGSGFKMVTNVAPTVNQSVTGTMSTVDVPEKTTRTESHEVITPQKKPQVGLDSTEDEKSALIELRQAKLIVEQKEAMEKAQQEALQRAQMAQQQAIKEAQERAQREVQMRVQQAQAEAKAKQAEAEAKAKQAQAEAKKRVEQEALRRAEREAQIKAERERAEQLRMQQQAKMMAAKQAQQVLVQAKNLQQNQPSNVQQKQQTRQQPNQQQSQVPTRQSQILEKQPQATAKQPQVQSPKYQAPIKQVQQIPQQQHQRKGPAVPAKPGRQTAPAAATAVRGGPVRHKLSAQIDEGNGLQAQVTPVFRTPAQQQTSGVQIMPNTGDNEIQVMRGGDIQQAYLNNLVKPAEILPQQEAKPIHTQDDQSWVTQNRVPVGIRAPEPAKITIPDLHGSVEVKPTVIVPHPMQTTRVEWNEFPEMEVKEIRDVPRVKAGEWHPDNQGEITGAQSVKSAYQPGRIGNVWPPLQNENVAQRQEVTVTKAAEDTAWRRDEKFEVETGTAWSKTAPHSLQRVWPPPESEVRTSRSVASRLKAVQWPPPEFEQHFHQDVDILQTRLPVKPNQRQWPPPPPEYEPILEQTETLVEQKRTITQVPAQPMQNRTSVTKGTIRVGGER